jgi:parvulin-like peptidyl-prolyl isomerase
MKRTMIVGLAVALAAAACSGKKEAPVKMAAGTPAYQLAKDLAAVVPSLDPEKVIVIITSKKFEISVGDVLQMFLESMGSQAQGIKNLDADRIKTAIERAGVQIGERKLLLEAALKAKKTVAPEEVTKALETQYARAGGEAQYLNQLKTYGITIDYVKRSVTEDLTIGKYLDGVLAAGTKVTDAEIQKAYQEDQTATVRHILLLTQGKSPAEKMDIRKKMEDVLARAKKGEDFAALAKQYSEDPGSKDNGGLYENFGRGKMVKPFEDAAFTVPVGGISGIVETTFGFHILKIESRKKETQPLEQVKAQLESQIKQQKQNAAFETLLTGMKKDANFQVIPIK